MINSQTMLCGPFSATAKNIEIILSVCQQAKENNSAGQWNPTVSVLHALSPPKNKKKGNSNLDTLYQLRAPHRYLVDLRLCTAPWDRLSKPRVLQKHQKSSKFSHLWTLNRSDLWHDSREPGRLPTNHLPAANHHPTPLGQRLSCHGNSGCTWKMNFLTQLLAMLSVVTGFLGNKGEQKKKRLKPVNAH